MTLLQGRTGRALSYTLARLLDARDARPHMRKKMDDKEVCGDRARVQSLFFLSDDITVEKFFLSSSAPIKKSGSTGAKVGGK